MVSRTLCTLLIVLFAAGAAGAAPRVILGQRTVAGETILGQIGDARVVPGIQQ